MADFSVSIGCDSELSSASNLELLTAVSWLSSAPADLVQAARNGQFEKFWRAWLKSISSRTDRKLARRRVASRCQLWPENDLREHPAKGLLTLIEKQDWSRLGRWAQQQLQVTNAWQDDRTENELLVLAEWLWTSPRLDAEIAFPIWRLALIRTLELAAYLAKPMSCQLAADRRLLTTGELPWLLSQLFGDVAGIAEFKQLAQQSLRNELLEFTDGDGTPNCELLQVLPRWMASFTRSVEVGMIVDEPLLEGETRFRFEDLVTKMVMLLDRDGRILGGIESSNRSARRESGDDVSPLVTMLLRACELIGLDEHSLAAESLRFRIHLANGGSSEKFRSDSFSESPDERLIVTDSDLPATQSDWAGWACLRNWWAPTGNTAVVRHDGPSVQLQLCLLGVPFVDGEWGLNVRLDGQLLSWTDAWKCICWTSDTDMDYIELQLDMPDGTMLCRQVMVSRKDHFLVVADAVSKAGSRRIDLVSTLPLRRGVKAKADVATREIRLASEDVKVRCFPVALPDDRLHSTVGRFDVDAGHLRLVQAATNEGLYAPIVLDWSPDRTPLEAEWRSLTITEEGKKIAPWQAAGHRFRLGKLHLVIYRSLQHSEDSRALLGLHTDRETVIAQFNDQGYVLPIVSVDA